VGRFAAFGDGRPPEKPDGTGDGIAASTGRAAHHEQAPVGFILPSTGANNYFHHGADASTDVLRERRTNKNLPSNAA
jgi:hypothetical protein